MSALVPAYVCAPWASMEAIRRPQILRANSLDVVRSRTGRPARRRLRAAWPHARSGAVDDDDGDRSGSGARLRVPSQTNDAPWKELSDAERVELKEFAEALAEAAEQVVRPYFRVQRNTLNIDSKADASPVTVADKSAEKAMRTMIESRFPQHGILGEEFGESELLSSTFVWVLDPIDGTKAFISGKPTFGTLIALVMRGVPILGVINQPISKERWIGCAWNEALLFNGQYLPTLSSRSRATSNPALLADCLMSTTTPDMFLGTDMARYRALAAQVKVAMFGSDCYAYALLASGFVELVVEADLKPWDYMALIPIVQAAGGIITDWQGRALNLESDGRVIAALNAGIHRSAIAYLSGSFVEDGMSGEGGESTSVPSHMCSAMTGWGYARHMHKVGGGFCAVAIKCSASDHFSLHIETLPGMLEPHRMDLLVMTRDAIQRGAAVISVEYIDSTGLNVPFSGAKSLWDSVQIAFHEAMHNFEMQRVAYGATLRAGILNSVQCAQNILKKNSEFETHYPELHSTLHFELAVIQSAVSSQKGRAQGSSEARVSGRAICRVVEELCGKIEQSYRGSSGNRNVSCGVVALQVLEQLYCIRDDARQLR
ncbi:Bifunctional phosphatase IMPL2, chloroplastic [Porphyridium purpureum]|uniref:histidinol-phosphatase n=1 Tax=Porphyridium purpureum TaxID=35688 RepID=A0A5J4YSX2_PORPP|nr:Bifunctional phosphatase IMPL2, chloroplastic [Porphyridium purpureum]|eukprot:POR2679..scf227_4